MIFNREFKTSDDGRVVIMQAGTFPHPEGMEQVVDSAALDSIKSKFDSERANPNHPGILVDFDHFSQDVKRPSEAAGWITAMDRVGDKLVATIDWSDAGESAVRNGRYRLLSPVFQREDMQDLGENQFRPLRLDSVGLTNQPVMKGLQPISNRAGQRSLSATGHHQAAARKPGEAFQSLVFRLQSDGNIDFTRAWNLARAAAPEVFNRSFGMPVSNRELRDPAAKANRQSALVTLRALANRTGFEAEWNAAQGPDKILNRLATDHGVDALARAVRADWCACHDPDSIHRMIGRPPEIKSAFDQAVRQLMAERGLSEDKAFDAMQDYHPDLFWSYVLLFEE